MACGASAAMREGNKGPLHLVRQSVRRSAANEMTYVQDGPATGVCTPLPDVEAIPESAEAALLGTLAACAEPCSTATALSRMGTRIGTAAAAFTDTEGWELHKVRQLHSFSNPQTLT